MSYLGRALRTSLTNHKRWRGSLCIYGLIVLGFRLQGSVDMSWFVQASGVATESDFSLTESLDMILKVIYIILWPLLVVAGMAMDNSLVLGEVFHLDRPIWQIWRMMTNFANFGLGFIVLFQIFKYIFGFDASTKGVFDIIKKALIAGIGIQASFFGMLALLDLSTIMTYSVGSLPMTVIRNDTESDLNNKKILEVTTTLDYGKSGTKDINGKDASYDMSFGCGDNKGYEYCYFQSGYVYAGTDGHGQYCVLGGIYAQDNVVFIEPGSAIALCGQTEGLQLDGQADKDRLTVAKGTLSGAIATANEQIDQRGCGTMGDVISQSKGMVKPLVTIYASLLDFASISLSDDQTSVPGITIQFLLKTIIALLLIVPLALLAVLLLVRVGFMWFYIIFLPIYVIKWSFGLKFSILGDDQEKDAYQGVLKAIFMPVVVVFALSMGLVFLNLTISKMSPTSTGGQETLLNEFGWTRNVDGGASCMQKISYSTIPTVKDGNPIITLGIQNSGNNYGASMFLDFFSYIFVNIFAIAVMWLMYFAAAKRRQAGDGIVGVSSRKKKIEQLMGSMPVVPIPGGGSVGLKTAFDLDPNGRGLAGSTVRSYESGLRQSESAAIQELMTDKFVDAGRESEAVAKEFITKGGTTYNQAARAGLETLPGKNASANRDYLNNDRIKEFADRYDAQDDTSKLGNQSNTATNKKQVLDNIRHDIAKQGEAGAPERWRRWRDGGFAPHAAAIATGLTIDNMPYTIDEAGELVLQYRDAADVEESLQQMTAADQVKTVEDVNRLNARIATGRNNEVFEQNYEQHVSDKTFAITTTTDGTEQSVTYKRDADAKQFAKEGADPQSDQREGSGAGNDNSSGTDVSQSGEDVQKNNASDAGDDNTNNSSSNNGGGNE